MIDATFWLGAEGVPLLRLERHDGDVRTFYNGPALNGEVHYWIPGHYRIKRCLWRNDAAYGGDM